MLAATAGRNEARGRGRQIALRTAAGPDPPGAPADCRGRPRTAPALRGTTAGPRTTTPSSHRGTARQPQPALIGCRSTPSWGRSEWPRPPSRPASPLQEEGGARGWRRGAIGRRAGGGVSGAGPALPGPSAGGSGCGGRGAAMRYRRGAGSGARPGGAKRSYGTAPAGLERDGTGWCRGAGSREPRDWRGVSGRAANSGDEEDVSVGRRVGLGRPRTAGEVGWGTPLWGDRGHGGSLL